MTVKLLITGATGYIAGDVLHLLSSTHPELSFTVTARAGAKADLIKAQVPQARTLIVNNSDVELLREEASKADIVINAAASSEGYETAKALILGLLEGHSSDKPGYYLHTSGAGILTYFDSRDNLFGIHSTLKFNDWDGIDEITVKMPPEAFHRHVDEVVLDYGKEHGDVIKTAVLCPPTIYGRGRGPVNKRGRQVYELTSHILKSGCAPILGEGKARWNNIHITDLSRAYLLLVEAAISQNHSSEVWGIKGYYFVENGEHIWGDLAQRIAEKAYNLGYISGVVSKQLEREEAIQVAGFESLSWGLNSRGKSVRLGTVLGWQPSAASLEEEIIEILRSEREVLLTKETK